MESNKWGVYIIFTSLQVDTSWAHQVALQGVLTWIAFLDLNCKVLAIGSCGLENWIKTMSLCWGQNPECVWTERGMALQQRALLGPRVCGKN